MIRTLFVLLFFFNILFSDVILKAPSSFVSGDAVRFIIEYNGSEEPVFPNIDKIDGFRVESAGKSNQITIINGKRSQSIAQNYIFYPNKDVTIPSFEIKTPSTSYKTDPKKIVLKTASKTQSDDFDLSISVDKSSLYVGENTLLTLKFKYKLGVNIVNMELNQPNFDGFWVKSLGKSKRGVENGFETHTLEYILFPQKAGGLKIEPASINVALSELPSGRYSFFGAPTKVKRFYSNELSLDVKALPQNLELIGDFKIDTSIDKNEVKLGEAVSYKLEIKGSGNLDDLDDIKLDIPNATVYENKPEKKYDFNNGIYSGVYTKSFSIVADSSFEIPSIKVEYYDKGLKQKKVIKSKSYNVKVIGAKSVQKEVVLQKAQPEQKVINEVVVNNISYKDKILFFIMGMICSSLLIFILYYFKKNKDDKEENDKPLIKKVRSASNKNELLSVLSPYLTKDEKFDTFIYTLENIDDRGFKSHKKEIIKKLKSLDF